MQGRKSEYDVREPPHPTSERPWPDQFMSPFPCRHHPPSRPPSLPSPTSEGQARFLFWGCAAQIRPRMRLYLQRLFYHVAAETNRSSYVRESPCLSSELDCQ